MTAGRRAYAKRPYNKGSAALMAAQGGNDMKKTALVLSGGGSRGAYEIGVWKGLKKLRISIDMAAGTSVGAINGAMVAQKALKQAEHLWLQMETDMIFDIESSGIPSEDAVAYAREIVLHGGAGSTGLAKLLHQYINEDKIRRSSIEYGLVTVQFPSFEKHALYARTQRIAHRTLQFSSLILVSYATV